MDVEHFYLTIAMIYMSFAVTLIGWVSVVAVTNPSQRRRHDAYRVLRLVICLGTGAAALVLGLARAGIL